MSTTAASEVDAILDRIRNWPSPTRIALARRILETLEASASADTPRSPDPFVACRPTAPPACFGPITPRRRTKNAGGSSRRK